MRKRQKRVTKESYNVRNFSLKKKEDTVKDWPRVAVRFSPEEFEALSRFCFDNDIKKQGYLRRLTVTHLKKMEAL